MSRKLILFAICTMLSNVSPSSSNLVHGDTFVFICTGAKAYSYHNNYKCSGLNRCRAEIKKVTLKYAKTIKRTPCKICYK